MKTRFLAVCLLLGAAALSADWTRRADIQGNITDVAIPEDKSEVFISTDGAGVWWWNGGLWVERNSGLDDLRIRALVVQPDNPAFLKAAAVSGRVFKSMDYGANWAPDSAGLNDIADAFVPTDLSMAWDDAAGQWYTYMATLGGGVLRQGSNGLWLPINTGLTNMDILSVAACSMPSTGGHRVLAGSRFNPDGFHPGRLYRYDFSDNFWAPVGGLPSSADYSVPSIAFHQEGLAMAALSVSQDGSGHGIYYTTDTNLVNWGQVCSRPPDHSFLSVDYIWGTDVIITAGTPFGLVYVDPPWSCGSSPYRYFCKFRGAVTAIGLQDWNTGVAGGPGKGPIQFNPSNPLDCPSNRRQGLQDNNILDIATGPWFGTAGGDNTIFTASGIAGVYKNWDAIFPGFPPQEGYFYRMIGDPASWGIPSVLRVRPVPNYNENGCRPNRTVFACTNGSGVMRSYDGGRSWEYANGGSRILDGAVVTDIAFHPFYDGAANTTLWAAAYGRGVFESQDNGASWFPKGVITNPRVLCLAAAWDNTQYHVELLAGCRTFNLPVGQNGLFWWNGDSWSPQGGSTLTGISVSVIGLPREYPTSTCLYFIGTENSGVMFTNDCGTNFYTLNTGLPAGAHIFDLRLAPSFSISGDTTVLIAVRPTGPADGGAYVTGGMLGWAWNRITNGLPDARELSVAFSPQYLSSGTIFCGHVTQGLYFASLDPYQPAPTMWQPSAGFFNVPPNVTGLAVSPDDPDTLYASTLHDGVFLSRDGGDSFQPWGGNLYFDGGTALCSVPTVLSVAVTHQTPPSQNLFLLEDFSGAFFPPSGWEVWDGGTTGINYRWRRDGIPCDRDLETGYPGLFSGMYAIEDSDCETSSSTQNDWLVTYYMDTSSAQRVLLQFNQFMKRYSGTEHAYVKVCSSATGGNCTSPSGNWVQVVDFVGTQDVLQRSSLDLTPWKGTSMRVAFHYTAAWDWWWALDDMEIVQLLPRVVVGTKDHGICYADAGDTVFFGTFLTSNLISGTVNELRYDGIAEDMRASHVPDGDYGSADYGATWTQVPGVTPGLGLTDVSYPSGAFWERGKTSFVWGCSSGKTTPGARGLGDGSAWYYDPLHDCNVGTPGIQPCWQHCGPQPGLNVYEDFRAVLELNSGTVLMGSIGTGSGGSWQGLYRSEDHCGSWEEAGEGLPPSPMVYALYQDPAQGYILASVVDSNTSAPDDGGVYYSDATSEGRAWAKTTMPTPAPGSRELAGTVGGTQVYTGQAEDGVFSTGSGSIGIGQPTAYFETVSEACIGQAVQFYNYSAGGPGMTQLWTFGDGQTSTLANPTNTYAAAATYYPSLNVSNGSGSDPYDLPAPGLTVRAELDLGSSLRAVKSGSNVILSWTDLNQGETGYQVWASNSASSGAPYGSELGADAASTTVTGYTYWRVQAKSASHICGDGPAGGSW